MAPIINQTMRPEQDAYGKILEVTRTLGKRIYYKVLEESSDHYEFHSHITLRDLRNNDKNITVK